MTITPRTIVNTHYNIKGHIGNARSTVLPFAFDSETETAIWAAIEPHLIRQRHGAARFIRQGHGLKVQDIVVKFGEVDRKVFDRAGQIESDFTVARIRDNAGPLQRYLDHDAFEA